MKAAVRAGGGESTRRAHEDMASTGSRPRSSRRLRCASFAALDPKERIEATGGHSAAIEWASVDPKR